LQEPGEVEGVGLHGQVSFKRAGEAIKSDARGGEAKSRQAFAMTPALMCWHHSSRF
jgi:hypothetical protein